MHTPYLFHLFGMTVMQRPQITIFLPPMLTMESSPVYQSSKMYVNVISMFVSVFGSVTNSLTLVLTNRLINELSDLNNLF